MVSLGMEVPSLLIISVLFRFQGVAGVLAGLEGLPGYDLGPQLFGQGRWRWGSGSEVRGTDWGRRGWGVGGLESVPETESLQFCHHGGADGQLLHKSWVVVALGGRW